MRDNGGLITLLIAAQWNLLTIDCEVSVHVQLGCQTSARFRVYETKLLSITVRTQGSAHGLHCTLNPKP